MLNHENSNIEIINKNLWAVRFSLIPMIPQMSWEPDPKIPAEKTPFQLSPTGIMVLNKDFKQYTQIKNCLPALMKLKPKALKSEFNMVNALKNQSSNSVIYRLCLQMETMRRDNEKVVDANGNDQNSGSNL